MVVDDSGIVLTSSVRLNTLIWIRSLPENEKGPSSRILEDIEQLSQQAGFRLEIFEAGSRDELAAIMAELSSKAWQAGLLPIIHLDLHGTLDDGVRLWPSQDSVDWSLLGELLRDINIATGNNLCCVAGCCFGIHAMETIDISKPTPAYVIIGPEHRINVGFLEDHLTPFYRDLFTQRDVIRAHEKHLSTGMTLYHCEKMLVVALARYIRNSVVGKRGARRREHLLTDIVAKKGNLSLLELRKARKLIRYQLTPTQDMIDQYSSKFLIGRSSSVTATGLLSFVRSAPSKLRSTTP